MTLKDIQVLKQITISFFDLFATTIVHQIWQLRLAMMWKNTDTNHQICQEKVTVIVLAIQAGSYEL